MSALIQQFEERYVGEPNSGCWLWIGTVRSRYGTFHIPLPISKTVLAHRMSWELHRGAIPDGLHVCHKCDTPLCVNPRHLFLGTHQDNMADMVAKGRHVRGAKAGRAKLADEQVIAIRAAAGTLKEISEQFGISDTLASDIRRGRVWRHLLPKDYREAEARLRPRCAECHKKIAYNTTAGLCREHFGSLVAARNAVLVCGISGCGRRGGSRSGLCRHHTQFRSNKRRYQPSWDYTCIDREALEAERERCR